MAIIYFPVIVETGDLPGCGVFFPDLPGLASASFARPMRIALATLGFRLSREAVLHTSAAI